MEAKTNEHIVEKEKSFVQTRAARLPTFVFSGRADLLNADALAPYQLVVLPPRAPQDSSWAVA
jgi:hypothetical protein